MKRLPSLLIIAVTGIAGASTMILEVAGAHALAPGFGTGIYAWAAMIVVALSGLAGGYASGGLMADRWPGRLAGRVLPVTLLVGGTCLSLDALVWHRVVIALGKHGPRLGALAAASILFLVPFAALGAVFPVSLKLWTKTVNEVGRRGGLLSAVSAIGSIVGAGAAGFLLVPTLTLETVFGGCAAALILTAGILLLATRSRMTGLLAILAAGLPMLVPAQRLGQGVRSRRASLFGPVEVIDRGGVRFLVVSGTVQGAMLIDSQESLFPYVQVLGEALRRNSYANPRKILLVGLGAGLLPRVLEPGECMTVEVDPAILGTARGFFAFDSAQFPVHIADGRAFLLKSHDAYDAVIFDAYGGGNHPYHLLTKECLELARSRLRPDGMLVLNYLGYVRGVDGRLVRSLEATLRAVLADVDIYASEEVEGYANAIFLAHPPGIEIDWPEGPYERVTSFLDGNRAQLLTDSRNPVALWTAAVEQRWRDESRRMLAVE